MHLNPTSKLGYLYFNKHCEEPDAPSKYWKEDRCDYFHCPTK